MVVNCPKCQGLLKIEPGNFRTCMCGAKLAVDEAGNVHLIDALDTPPANDITLAGLEQEELRKLKNRSLYMLQWGWFTGICCILAAVAIFLPLAFISAIFLPAIILVPLVIALAGVANFYIYTRCRTKAARIFVYADSGFMLVSSGFGLLTTLIAWGGVCSFMFTLLYFIIAYNLFMAARARILWGETHFAYSDLKAAYERKMNGGDVSDIAPTKKPVSFWDKFFTALGFLKLAVIIILFVLVPIITYREHRVIKEDPQKQFAAGERHFKAENYSEAAKCYRNAADKGMKEAQFALGNCYMNGQGVEKDQKIAAEWFRKAADQGMKEAQFALGNCYMNGQGVEKDPKLAAEWFRKAADQGMKEAQDALKDPAH